MIFFQRILYVALLNALQLPPWKNIFQANYNFLGVFLVEKEYHARLFQEDDMSSHTCIQKHYWHLIFHFSYPSPQKTLLVQNL